MLVRFAAALTLWGVSLAPAADPSLLALVSPEAKAVGGINVARAVSSPLGQFLLLRMNDNDAGFREFVNATGLDPRRDVREVVFASLTATPNQHRGIMAARGVFNGPQILAAAKAKGFTSATYKSVELVEQKNQTLAVLNGSLLLIGDQDAVRTAIDRRSVSSLPSAGLLAKAPALMNRYDAWFLSTGPVAALTPTPRPGVNGPAPAPPPSLQAIVETSGGAIFDSIVRMEAEAVTKTAEDAQNLAGALRFMLGFVQMSRNAPADAAHWNAVWNSLDIRAQGSTVKASLQAPEADVEALLTPKKPAAAAAPESREKL